MQLVSNARISRAISQFVASAFLALCASIANAAPLLYASVGGQFVAFRADTPGTIVNTINDIRIAAEVREINFRLIFASQPSAES